MVNDMGRENAKIEAPRIEGINVILILLKKPIKYQKIHDREIDL